MLEQRQQLLEDARKIEEYIQPLPPPQANPALVVLSGLPGSGKSYFCRRLISRHPMARLESDALRKALFGQPTYSPEESRRLFSACHLVLSRLLAIGIPAILDATNLREVHRRQLYRIADRHKAKLILVQLQAPSSVVHKRLEARVKGLQPQDLSDAGPEVYERLQRDVEPIARPHISVDSSAGIEAAIAAVLQQIENP
ncbi:MAG: AAA family ATPase [Dehalococcoidia bacterium]